MSSSSRSIAAARQKRAGEQSQPMNTSRPVTSISSQGAFAQQQQYQQQMMSQSIPVGSKNVSSAQNINKGTGGRNNTNIIQNNQSEQSTKISISNVVGLITLRLGRLESIINDSIENGVFNNDNGDHSHNNTDTTPNNMKLVSDEVFENIVNRINLLESKVIQFTNQNEKLENEMKNMQGSVDILNTLLSSFINDTNEKFTDYENALSEIEKNFEVDTKLNMELTKEETDTVEISNVNDETLENAKISNETQENNDKANNENGI
jgi:hypothetical protein